MDVYNKDVLTTTRDSILKQMGKLEEKGGSYGSDSIKISWYTMKMWLEDTEIRLGIRHETRQFTRGNIVFEIDEKLSGRFEALGWTKVRSRVYSAVVQCRGAVRVSDLKSILLMQSTQIYNELDKLRQEGFVERRGLEDYNPGRYEKETVLRFYPVHPIKALAAYAKTESDKLSDIVNKALKVSLKYYEPETS